MKEKYKKKSRRFRAGVHFSARSHQKSVNQKTVGSAARNHNEYKNQKLEQHRCAALREEKVLSLAEQRLMYTPAVLNDGSVSGEDEDDGGDGCVTYMGFTCKKL